MPPTSTTCPTAQDLEQLLAGRLTGPAAEAALSHLEQCGRCLVAARGLAPADPLLDALRQDPSGIDAAESERAAGFIARLREHRPATAEALTVDVVAPHLGGAAETRDAIVGGVEWKAAQEGYAFLAPPEEPDEIGRLGPYRVLRVLGHGGMGVVFHAEDPKLQRGVALKVMHPAVAASASAGQRFLREARATAALKHDHVVTIYQVDEDRGVPFLAMELLEGESLDDRLKRPDPLPASEVIRIGREIAEGLEASHSHGLIHRDVKPSNVWLEAGRSRVKILDFGLARPVGPADGRLTQEGLVVGTPAFMAPEQAKSLPLDKRCDLFSLGCVLYRMATGRDPFVSPNALSLLVAVINETPSPPAEIAPDLPPGLSDLILRLLAKDPADRPGSAAAVAAALEEIGRGDAIPVPSPATPPRRRRRIAVLGVCLLVLGLAVAAAVVLRVQTPDGEVVVRTDDSDIELTATKGGALVRIHDLKSGQTWQLDANKYTLGMADDADGLTIDLPDGKPFVLRRKGDGVVTITRQAAKPAVGEAPKDRVPLDALRREDIPRAALGWPGGGDPDRAPPELVAILGDGRFRILDGPWFPEYSPDGRRLAVPSGPAIFLFDAASGQYLRTFSGHADQVYRVTFSPDGLLLASASSDHTIRIWDVATGRMVPLTGHLDIVFGVAFSPDLHHLASSDRSGVVMVWDLPAGQGRPMTGKHDGRVVSVAYSPDGKTLVSAGMADGVVRLWDPASGELKSQLTSSDGDLHRELAYSPDGKLLACGSDATLTVWDANTLHERFTIPASAAGCTVFTADSRTVVTATHDLHAGVVPRVMRWDARTGKQLGMFPVRSQGDYATCSLAPDGKTVAALGTGDRVVGVYDLVTGELRFPQTGHTNIVAALAFTRDGKLLATGAKDGNVKLWDLTNGKELRTLLGHIAEVRTASFSPDGTTLATGAWSADGGRLWDVKSGRALHTLSTGSWWFDAVAFRPDGRAVASGGADKAINLWDAADGTKIQSAPAHGGAIRSLSYSTDGRLLASSGMDSEVKIWDAETGDLKQPLSGSIGSVNSVAFFPDGATLASAGDDGLVRLWWSSTGALQQVLAGPAARLQSVAVRRDGQMIAASGEDGTVRLWDLTASPPREKTFLLFPLGQWVNAAVFSPDGRHLVTANPDGTVYVFRLAPPGSASLSGLPAAPTTLTEVRRFKGGIKIVTKVALSRDGGRAVSADLDKDVILWDVKTGEEVRRFKGHTDRVFAVDLSPDGRFVLSGAQDKTVRLWDVAGGKEVWQFHTEGNVSGVRFSPNGALAAAASSDGHVRFWNPKTGERLRDFQYSEPVTGIDLGPEGKQTILKTSAGTLLLCDAETGKEVRRLQGHEGDVCDAVFAVDGRHVLSGGQDQTVRLWDAADGREMRCFQGCKGRITSVALSPDGRWVVSGCEDRTLRLWDAATGQEIDRRAGAGTPWSSMAFSGDGKLLLATDNADNCLQLWRLPDIPAGNR